MIMNVNVLKISPEHFSVQQFKSSSEIRNAVSNVSFLTTETLNKKSLLCHFLPKYIHSSIH